MRKIPELFGAFVILGLALIVAQPQPASAAAAPDGPENAQMLQGAALNEEVRHQLVMLPYHTVFDWLEADVDTNGKVTLSGQVDQPALKHDAEWRVKQIHGVSGVTNNIEVLPLSNFDDQLRQSLYRSIYRPNSPLFRYALQSVGPIHIIVKNGRVTLKGMVATQAEKDLALIAANGVSNVFHVQNDLEIERRPAPSEL